MMFRVITITALAGLVSANSFSIGCLRVLSDLTLQPAVSACLKPDRLFPILVGAGNQDDSIITHLDEWLSSMCGAPACSQSVLNIVADQLHQGCSAEFALDSASWAFDMIRKNYGTLRKVACLKDGQYNCLTATLRNIESATNTMNLQQDNINAIVKLFKEGLPSKVMCTDCVKAMYTMINQSIPGTFSPNYGQYAANTCSASFVDGGIPPGLIQTAGDNPVVPEVVSATTRTLPVPTTPVMAPTPTGIPISTALTSATSPPIFNVPASTTPTSAPSVPPHINKNAAAGAPYFSSSAVMIVSVLALITIGVI